MRLVKLLDTQREPVMFAKLGPRVEVSDSLRAWELALEATCSHPLQATRRGGVQRQQICILGSQATNLEARPYSSGSHEDDRVVVEGIWEQLGLKESHEAEEKSASASGDSGESTDHEMYRLVIEGYEFEGR